MKKRATKIAQYHLHQAHPEKLQFEMYCLNKYRNRSVTEAASPHSHSYYQVIWFFEDGGTHTVDFTTYSIEKNTVLFISKDQVHHFDDNLAVKGKLIHFNESFFMHTDVDVFLKYNIFKSTENPCYPIDLETAAVGRSYLELIEKELDKRHEFGFEEVIRFLLKSFLINLERVHQKDSIKKLELYSPYELQFFKFKELVEAHYADGCSVSNYAESLNISSKTLTTITKSITGKTPAEVIAERITLEAKRLLKFSTLQVAEVAFKLGFEDASYFIKYFKRQVAMSPMEYRKMK